MEAAKRKGSDLQEPLRKKRRQRTVGIMIPDSILANAQSFELRTYLVGQIARAAAIYNVDEIVVLRDGHSSKDFPRKGDLSAFFIRNLEYIETPQYLRKLLFPMHPDLKFSGLLNPLDTPHHLRADEWSKYREGVVVERPTKSDAGSWVNIGLKADVQVDIKLQPRTRVTVKLTKDENGKISGKIVSSSKPRRHRYWGYTTRIAECFSDVLAQSPYESGYDLVIGTSDVGDERIKLPKFDHALICFGGLSGLEDILESDESITTKDPYSVFQFYLNSCPSQGTRTIRTEEAVLITLSHLSAELGI